MVQPLRPSVRDPCRIMPRKCRNTPRNLCSCAVGVSRLRLVTHRNLHCRRAGFPQRVSPLCCFLHILRQNPLNPCPRLLCFRFRYFRVKPANLPDLYYGVFLISQPWVWNIRLALCQPWPFFLSPENFIPIFQKLIRQLCFVQK